MGKMYAESNMETYITMCKIDSQWEFAVCLRKLKQGLCFNLEGLDGEGDSKGRRYMYTYGWFMLSFDRKKQNSEKQLSFNKEIFFLKKREHIRLSSDKVDEPRTYFTEWSESERER